MGPPDVVHVHELFRPPHLALRSVLASTPYVVSTHGATAAPNLARYRLRKEVYGRLVERRSVGRSSALVALTGAEAADLRRWLPETPLVRTIPNAADPDLLGAAPWSPPGSGRPTLISLSRWDVRHKGLDRMAALATLLPEVTFRVHGGPCGNEEDRLEALRAQAGPNLELAPPVVGAERTQALRRAHGFVLLSRWEGLSMALLEAMALGMACFVSEEVAETVDDRSTCIVVPADAAAAADVVAAALADRQRLAAVGAAARGWVLQHAAPEVVARASASLYASVSGRSVGVGALASA
jgi:glycosyltransferase involved in cell wall biosynthesis